MWFKINSRKARNKIESTGIRFRGFVNWPSMNHYYVTADANAEALGRIKGISLLQKRPAGSFTKFWKRDEK